MKYSGFLTAASVSLALAACGAEPQTPQYGANPDLPQPKRGLLPNMTIAKPVEWGDRLPKAFLSACMAAGIALGRWVTK